MNIFRIDLILQDIWASPSLGPGWCVAALAVLLFVTFGKLVKSMLLTVCVLVCTQFWFIPLYVFSRQMRWSLLLILAVRAAVYIRATRPAERESQAGRRIAVLLGSMAAASALWADSPEFSIEVAASFCLGLFITFGLLWRLADGDDVMESFARGALFLSLALFGGAFLIAGLAYMAGAWDIFDAMRLEYVDGGFERYRGLFYNPNAVGLIGTMMLPIIVAAPKETFGRAAWLRLPTCALALASIFLSGSRSAAIGAVFALALVALYRFGAGAVVTLALGAVALAFLAVFSPPDEMDSAAVSHITRTKHLSTLSGRLELWQEGWDDAQGHLLVGHGWGHNRVLGGDIDTDNVLETGSVRNAKNLHNAHLQLLLDLGVVGVCVFWAFCLCILQAGWWLLTAPKTAANAVGVVVFTSVLALLADTWVHGAIWSMGSPTTLAFWGLCALTLKQGSRARNRPAEAPAPAPGGRAPLPVGAA